MFENKTQSKWRWQWEEKPEGKELKLMQEENIKIDGIV